MRVVKPNVELLQRDDTYEGVMRHIERCGRVCYKSEDCIEEGSAEKFIAGIIARGHESVLEHGSFVLWTPDEFTYYELRGICRSLTAMGHRTFLRIGGKGNKYISGNVRAWRDLLKACWTQYNMLPASLRYFVLNCPVLFPEYQKAEMFSLCPCEVRNLFIPISRKDLKTREDILAHYDQTLLFTCDRGVSHEFVRHRTLSPSQESTRYCNYSKGKFGAELTFIQPCFWRKRDTAHYRVWEEQCLLSESSYMELLEMGKTTQEARSILPNSLKTELVLTGVQKDWQHFLNLRCAKSAHPQAREVALMANKLFKEDKHSIIEYKEETNND